MRFVCVGIAVAILAGCTTVAPRGAAPRGVPVESRPSTPPVASRPRPIPVPPWQLWTPETLGSAEIAQAEQYLQQGNLEAAVDTYRQALVRSPVPQVRDEALVRLSGTLLKLGRSQEALTEISSSLKTKQQAATDADPRLGLIASYAYIHQKDWDQALAWLSLVYKKTGGQGVYARRALAQAKELAERLPPNTFEAFVQRWSVDPFTGRIFSAERLRRAQGGLASTTPTPDWFNAAMYRYELPPSEVPLLSKIEETEVLPASKPAPSANERIVLGVLLPLTGRFAEHAEKVRRGIEFAVAEMGAEANLELRVGDTQGEPDVAQQEYQRLVTEGATVILGPLLVKTTEAVAQKAQQLGVPIITFTKREGVTELGQGIFRLGATAQSQVDELLQYGVGEMSLTRYAVLYPDSEFGHEFAALFRSTASRQGARVTVESSYLPGDETSIREAVDKVAGEAADAVFLPDTLESAYPVLAMLDESPLKDAVLLGPAQWNDPIAIRGYGQLIDGAVYVALFFPRSAKPTVSSFVQRYVERYRVEPELLSAQAYDAAWLAVRALRAPGRASETLTERLKEAETFYGVTGKLDVEPSGEIERRMSVLRLHNGEVTEVMSGGVVSGFLADEQQRAQKQASAEG
ncbi:MAG: penicillin-binding protein activator [Bdellovibrionales bacterium]|nr:penicillin-binding protein activator [Bdellovibrionales bacterium]